jgi:hypothetical protein
MAIEGFPTTAENIIGATEASLLASGPVTEDAVAKFLDIPLQSARNALRMGVQLGLLTEPDPASYSPSNPLAGYLITASRSAKAAILRLVLEQFPPYRTFKQRLEVSATAPEAANQARAIHNIAAHREEVLNTLVGLGTYTNSLASQGAGGYVVADPLTADHLIPLAEAIGSREAAELHIRKRLGAVAADWIDRDEVLDPLITALQLCARVEQDVRAPILHAGNAVESFLVQLAAAGAVNLKGASGINSKADRLLKAGYLTTKHANMLFYLGHVRNAAEHGTDIDPDVNRTWDISLSTALEHVNVALSTITAIVAHQHGQFIV